MMERFFIFEVKISNEIISIKPQLALFLFHCLNY